MERSRIGHGEISVCGPISHCHFGKSGVRKDTMLITNCLALIQEFGVLYDDSFCQEQPWRCCKERPCSFFGEHVRVTQRNFAPRGCIPAGEAAAYPRRLSTLIALKVNKYWRERPTV